MDKKDLLKLLNNLDEGNETVLLKKHDRVLLIDGLNLFFRNFAMLNFVNQEGLHVGGLGGFIRSLGTLINQIQPTSIYIIFDGQGSATNRKNINSEYKSNRNIRRITNWQVFNSLEDENEAKINQIVRLIHYLKCLPVKVVSFPKVEADDIIAYLSKKLESKHNSKVFIVSSDKDFIQLITDNIIVYRPIEKDYYTKETVKEKFGIPAKNFILYKTLLGDSSDMIQGIKGLGEKGILKKFPELAEKQISLDDIFNICENKLKEHVIYARILQSISYIEKNYLIMDLANPMLDDKEKLFLDHLMEEKTPELNNNTFLKFYHEDGLGHLIKNIEYWLTNNFKNIISK
jgi:5'-3' exonuclease